MLSKEALSEESKRIYASEKLNNFRWIFKILATRSSHLLTEADRVSPELVIQLAELGQFAELAYSIVPLEFLFQNITPLLEPGFPLEGYGAIKDAILISSMQGRVGHLPAMVLYRPVLKQLVVAISGTSSVELALHDLRVLKHDHPSRRGQVHSGFWALYNGIKMSMFDAIKKGIESYGPIELVFAAHSMGGSISYLACMDLLSGDTPEPIPISPALRLALVAFGAPRTGDSDLVNFWRQLLASHRESYGTGAFAEYSVKAYNDGVPSLPPTQFGYRHFSSTPFYLDKTRLYHVHQSECEHALFTTEPPGPGDVVQFPKGGHNYYNGRDFERLGRRLQLLQNADIIRSGWVERYRELLSQNDS